jgi:hypothetical protein
MFAAEPNRARNHHSLYFCAAHSDWISKGAQINMHYALRAAGLMRKLARRSSLYSVKADAFTEERVTSLIVDCFSADSRHAPRPDPAPPRRQCRPARRDFEQVKEKLANRFKGVTACLQAPAEGLWRLGAKSDSDDIVIFEVMTEEIDLSEWSSRRWELERRFRQDRVIVRYMPMALV